MPQPEPQKIYAPADLQKIVESRRQKGEIGVFTNGCFDLLHLGHIRYLQEARKLGDYLILGLNSDNSVHQIKGPKRPLIPEQERAEIMSALESIDYVTIFSESTASALVSHLQPEIYVKGGDYSRGGLAEPDPSKLPEAATVKSYGGTVKLLPYIPGHSTTELIQKIITTCK